ncbi:hypothetical protein GRF29_96g492176 [Pseudopithomyces chartarum]|uniref:Uncharacterized protein n=1 Tax=Pseudopithomyces chartarum TaxID=1892770 RepID=A0AAN6LV07_9PLEO|nr:hypothetical protein GRF29_96g492176 [Pseudopithomyces chartarum]
MAPLTVSILSLLLSYSLTAIASPIPTEPHTLHKRSPSPRNIGIGFAIAISLLIFASFIFYLGVQYGRTGSWLLWRHHLPTTDKLPILDTDTLKGRISSPIQMHSSALPELSPVEAQPRFAELSPMDPKKPLELSASEKSVYEMGLPSLRRPSSVDSSRGKTFYSSRKSSIATVYRKSVASVRTNGKSIYTSSEKPPKVSSWFDRKSWFCQGAMEVEVEEKRARGKDGVEGVDESILETPAPAAVLEWKQGEKTDTMDWSGMEWLTRMYDERKSRRESGMRSFYIAGRDEKEAHQDEIDPKDKS